MSPKVPALPTRVTSIRRAPASASTTAVTATSPSRLKAMIAIGSGTAPTTRMLTTAVPSSSLSAVGSSTFPSLVTWSRRRASWPSNQSVKPRAASRTAAGNQYRWCGWASSQTYRGPAPAGGSLRRWATKRCGPRPSGACGASQPPGSLAARGPLSLHRNYRPTAGGRLRPSAIVTGGTGNRRRRARIS